METWYLRVIHHLEDGTDVNKLYMNDVCAKEFDSKEEVQAFIDRWLARGNQIAPGERTMPTFVPVTEAMFNSF